MEKEIERLKYYDDFILPLAKQYEQMSMPGISYWPHTGRRSSSDL